MTTKRVWLTGASSGIGAALATEYARAGYLVAALARRKDALVDLQQRFPDRIVPYVLDVTDHDALFALGQQFCSDFGVPDIVIANAGISVGTLTDELDDYTAFSRVIQTNLMGVVATFRPFVRGMKRRGSGRLVGVSSVAGVRGLPGAGAYSASKAAVSRYLESLRVELYRSGVTVTDLRPGYIRTPMTAVNTYRMPFLMDVDEAAQKFVRAIERGRSQATIPWQMSAVASLLPLVPNAVYDFFAARAGRKPRNLLP